MRARAASARAASFAGLLVLATLGGALAAATSGAGQQQPHQHQHQMQTSGARVAGFRPHHHHHHSQLNNHHQQQHQPQQESGGPAGVAPAADKSGQELHFGAKVALTILAGIVMLVASATFVDMNEAAASASQQSDTAHCDTHTQAPPEQSSHLLMEQRQARDQRSPSLSSHNSSTLFCSANSVASASVPILGRHSNRASGHFKRNLKLSLAKSDAAARCPADNRHQHQHQHQHQHNHDKDAHLLAPAWHAGEHSAYQQRGQTRAPEVSRRTGHFRWLSKQLARELFLAFSLRNSAALIFQRQQQQRKRAPSDDEEEEDEGESPQSIDSLHGLRFLSMIWLIVMHSYSFAFRWIIFAKSPLLVDIYKTAASQLLANGTFACDSFFFAGGFLLPYLAFRAPARARANRELAADNLSSSSSSPARSACSSPDIQQAHEQRRQQQQQRQPEADDDSRQSAVIFLTAPHAENNTNNNGRLATTPSEEAESGNLYRSEWRRELHTNEFTLKRALGNLLHRYVRMMPLMMAIIGLSATLLRYLGEGPAWDDSTVMFDKWCRQNWWINALFMHNFLNRENMCLSHSWYSAVDIQLFLLGQLILYVLFRSRKYGLLLCCACLLAAQLLTGALTLMHHLPAVPQLASFSEQTMNRYYGEIYIKPYCRASPYLIGILLAYLMRTTSLGQLRLNKWQVAAGWTASIALLAAILMAMQPAMNGRAPSELESALYSALSRPLWACATGWMIFACMTKNGGVFASILSARLFVPLSRLTYPAFLIHPIVMAVFYGSRHSSFEFSHYLMLYLILGNIVITYAAAFLLSALFELPLLAGERAVKRALRRK